MPEIGRVLMIVGGTLFLLGLVFALTGRFSWLGNLPGDIHWQRGSTSVYIPLTSMIVVSVLFSLLLNLIGRFWR